MAKWRLGVVPQRRKRVPLANALSSVLTLVVTAAIADAGVFDRVGFVAELSTNAHNVSGRVSIVDQDTIRIDDFTYDGGGIQVYVYLGTADEHAAFVDGLQVGPPLLGTAYNGGTLIIDLPEGHTLDGYNAVSIWCVPAQASFGSGVFEPPAYPRAGYSTVLAPGAHATSGIATIVDERTIRLDEFSYDGTAPLVYPYLGITNTNADFANGLAMMPQLNRAYNNETLNITLPTEQSLNGYTALSIWCVAFSVNFTSGAFPRARHDLDLDGDIDRDDGLLLNDCLSNPQAPHEGGSLCDDADRDDDNDVDLRDAAALSNALTGDGLRAPID